MIELIFGIYGLLWWLIFKKFKLIPINVWSVMTSALVAISTVALLLLLLNRFQPVTGYSRFLTVTTPIVAEVSGRVTEVVSEGGKPLKKGDVLFRIDPTVYQARVDALKAQLVLAEAQYAQERRLDSQGAGTKNDLRKTLSDLDRIKAELVAAKYNLDATEIRAPADGYVTQVTLRPGQMVMPMVFAQVMVFVHAEEPILVAGFMQNALQYINAGDEAEVAFDAIPGRVFAAKVRSIQPLLAEAQITAGGRLITVEETMRKGRMPVFVDMVDDISGLPLTPGASATVAVYTGEMHHLNIMRRIILRIASWENWVFFP